MNREQALTVKRGDMLAPSELWNASSNSDKQLASPTRVLSMVHTTGCQTGVMLLVDFTSGKIGWLDAGWFYAPMRANPNCAANEAA